MEYVRKLRDLKYNETVFELIAKQFELAKLDEARQGAIIQVADVAVPPDKKSYPPSRHSCGVGDSARIWDCRSLCYWSERWAEIMRDPEKHGRIRTLRELLSRKK